MKKIIIALFTSLLILGGCKYDRIENDSEPVVTNQTKFGYSRNTWGQDSYVWEGWIVSTNRVNKK